MNPYEDIKEGADGGMQAALDTIQHYGIPQAQGRAFATWLDNMIERLTREKEQAIADYREYVDQHPGQMAAIPVAETFYHPNKEAAVAAAEPFRKDPRVAQVLVQLEPDNGWVIVLIPALADLSEYKAYAEVQDGAARAKPVGKKSRYQPRTGADSGEPGQPKGDGPATAPVKGATARVWAIADGMPTADRASIIAACVAEGINPSTAGTQYSKWKKARIA